MFPKENNNHNNTISRLESKGHVELTSLNSIVLDEKSKHQKDNKIKISRKKVRKNHVYTHFSIYRRIWEYIIFVVSSFSLFEILLFGFIIEEYTFKIYAFIIFFDILFVLDLHVSIRTSYIRHGVEITKKDLLIQHYGKLSIIFHVISSTPLTYIPLFINNKSLYVFLCIPKLLRINRAIISLDLFNNNLLYYSWASVLTPYIIFMLFNIHLFSILFLKLAELENSPKSWIQRLGIEGWDFLMKYITSVYYVLTTILQIGFGDITPGTPSEIVLVITIQLIGVSLNLFILSKMIALAMDGENTSFIQSSKNMLRYLRSKNVEESLINDVTCYLQMRYDDSKGADDPSVQITNLPESLRSRLILDQILHTSRNISMFHTDSVNISSALSNMLTPKVYAPGDIIIKQGDINTDLIFLHRGMVDVIIDDNIVSRTEFKRGVSICDTNLFREMKNRFTIKASSHISGWCLTRLSLQLCVINRPDIKEELINHILNRYSMYSDDIKVIFSDKKLKDVLSLIKINSCDERSHDENSISR